jgi:exo-beta-1,3-glucanase (GH17 family)
LTTLVRTYSASNCDTAKNIIPAAKAKGFKVVLGVWYAIPLLAWCCEILRWGLMRVL